MSLLNFIQKRLIVFLAAFLVLGCLIDLGKKQAGELRTKQKQDAGTNEKTAKEKPAAQITGGVPQELAGKWCYLSNVQANDGGRMSEICITLNSDGTYEYYGETDSGNPSGSAHSQENDSGRWTATATTITAHSNGGETKNFTLEKRNHPKTGDPMLMIDGDAFVTAYQKTPW
ncbi:MAG: hypothetical protein JSS81_23945 [Acidobacteria bacterium]|nr:hypothetical protein [Acidobacteriota bacterium]